jgi:hypothetical protein
MPPPKALDIPVETTLLLITELDLMLRLLPTPVLRMPPPASAKFPDETLFAQEQDAKKTLPPKL